MQHERQTDKICGFMKRQFFQHKRRKEEKTVNEGEERKEEEKIDKRREIKGGKEEAEILELKGKNTE